MKTAALKTPLNLNQMDRNSCLSCVTANALHVLGVAETPSVEWVDQQVDRRAGAPAPLVRVARFMLETGLQFHSISAQDPARFLREGLDYLREYYRSEWTATWDKHWTPGRLERQRRKCLEDLELDTFPGMSRELIRPTLTHVRDWLDRGRVVMLAVDNSRDSVTCHTALVYAHHSNRRGGCFEVYVPERRGDCLHVFSARELGEMWLRSEGMDAIGRT